MNSERTFFINNIFNIENENEFQKIALRLFRYQAKENLVYREFISYLELKPDEIQSLEEIPFIPIGLFKTHSIISGSDVPTNYFESSGTTGMRLSRNYITDISIYEKSLRKGFENVFGNIEEYTIFALVPDLKEKKNSSLIYMIDDWIRRSREKRIDNKKQRTDDGYYLNDLQNFSETLSRLDSEGRKCIVIGVSSALWDFSENNSLKLENTIVIETGGMKGRRVEPVRQELHQKLKKGFGMKRIHSEYGMCELFSQAYSREDGHFFCPPWMKVMIHEINDPFRYCHVNDSGVINIIDLANIDSCSFISTMDLGRMSVEGHFEVLGRMDGSDIRGCNLMVI